MGFKPEVNGCDTTWRISQGGCWSDYTMILIDLVTGQHDTIRVNEPCSLTDCCSQNMIVCKDSAAKTTSITYLDFTSPSIDCDSTWLENPYWNGWILPCYSACNWLDGFDTTHVDPPPPPLMKSINGDLYDNKIGLSVNYEINSSIIDFTIRTVNLNEVKFYISTIDGKIIYSGNEYVNNGLNNFSIDRSSFKSGAYILSFEANGYIFKTEKLIITN